jgi:hypothetical protein
MAKHTSESIVVLSSASRLADTATIWITRTLSREGWPDCIFAFHSGDEIGPRMLARIAKKTGLRPEDL